MRNTNAFSEHKVGRVCPEYEFANSIKSERTLLQVLFASISVIGG